MHRVFKRTLGVIITISLHGGMIVYLIENRHSSVSGLATALAGLLYLSAMGGVQAAQSAKLYRGATAREIPNVIYLLGLSFIGILLLFMQSPLPLARSLHDLTSLMIACLFGFLAPLSLLKLDFLFAQTLKEKRERIVRREYAQKWKEFSIQERRTRRQIQKSSTKRLR